MGSLMIHLKCISTQSNAENTRKHNIIEIHRPQYRASLWDVIYNWLMCGYITIRLSGHVGTIAVEVTCGLRGKFQFLGVATVSYVRTQTASSENSLDFDLGSSMFLNLIR